MTRTITLRLSDAVYAMVKHYAARDQLSMNAWIESVLDGEDMRRRCAAHDRFMAARPDAVGFTEGWADGNLDELARR